MKKLSPFSFALLAVLSIGLTFALNALATGGDGQPPGVNYPTSTVISGGTPITWEDQPAQWVSGCGGVTASWQPYQFFVINSTGTFTDTNGQWYPDASTTIYSASATSTSWGTNGSSTISGLGLSLPSYPFILGATDVEYLGACGYIYAWTYSTSTVIYNASSTASPAWITMSLPVSSSTQPDFQNWKVITGDASPGTITIHYGLSGVNFQYTDTVDYSPFVNTNPLSIYKHYPLWFPPLTIPAEWQVYAELNMATSTATSTVVDFFIDPGYATTTPSSTLLCDVSTGGILVDPIGNVQDGICRAFTYLFIPKDWATQDLAAKYTALYTSLQDKPPFGYLAAITTDMAALNAPTSGTSTQLMNASATIAFAPLLSPLDNGMAIIIVLLLVLWIFHRARLIEL